MMSSPTKWSRIVPGRQKYQNMCKMNLKNLLYENMSQQLHWLQSTKFPHGVLWTAVIIRFCKMIIIILFRSPHKASFMPVSTLSIFGGKTPGVSNRCIIGRSHTWGQGQLQILYIHTHTHKYTETNMSSAPTWILDRTALVIPGSPPTRDARPEIGV